MMLSVYLDGDERQEETPPCYKGDAASEWVLNFAEKSIESGLLLLWLPFHWLNELLQIRVVILPYQRKWVQGSTLLWHTHKKSSHWKSPLLQPFPNLNYNKRNTEVGEIAEDGATASCQNNQRHYEKMGWRKWKRKSRRELKAGSFFWPRPSLTDYHEVRGTVWGALEGLNSL